MTGRETPPSVVIELSEFGTVRSSLIRRTLDEQDDMVVDIGDVRLIVPVCQAEELIDQWVTALTLSPTG